MVIGARPNQEWGTLPKIDVENVEADTYYRTADGVVHLDEVKDTPNAFVSKMGEQRQFERYQAWLARGKNREVNVYIRNTGPKLYRILRESILNDLNDTIVRDISRPFFRIGQHVFSMKNLDEMDQEAGRIVVILRAKYPELSLGDLLDHYFGTLEDALKTIDKAKSGGAL